MMRLIICLSVLVMLGSIAGCHESGADASRPLVVYASGPRLLAEALAAKYTEQTGVPVELFTATTGQIMAKLEAERYNRRADVVILASPIAAEYLKQQGRLLAHVVEDSDRFEPSWLRGSYNSPNGAAVGIAVRDEIFREGIEWSDVFGGEPAWRVVMPSPTRSGSSGEFVLATTIEHDETAWDMFAAGVAGGLEFASANSQAIAGLLSGTYDAIVGAVDYLILSEIGRGAPIQLVFPSSGSVVVERPVLILEGTRREESARAFVDFCFSHEAQTLSAEAWLIPADIQSRSSLQRPMPGRVTPTNSEVGLERLQLTMRRFQYDLEGAKAR